jgi:protein-tyrosine phosphatase
VISFFRSKPAFKNPLGVDMHSHLLAAMDDGVKTHEEAIDIIRYFHSLGYRKLITTPHIMNDYYRNEPDQIMLKLAELKNRLQTENIPVVIEAAAEYYLDEELMRKVESKTPLLTFGNSHLLFETNFYTEPYQLKDFIFKVITQGYKPVLAHPERYGYMTVEKAEEFRDRGVLLQINIPSIIGYYSAPIQRITMKLIDQGLVDLLSSDCHTLPQMQIVEKAIQNKYFRKAVDLPLLNYSL